MKPNRPQRKLPSSADDTQKLAQQAVEEARMILPGIQALFGFQLIAVFNARFSALPRHDQIIHFTAVILIAVAIGLIMTPAAYHRQVEPGKNTTRFVQLASMLVAAALVPLMVGLAMEIYILEELIFPGAMPNGLLALAMLAFFAGAWFGYPWWAQRHSGNRRHGAQ
jgi:hypothetical protein